SQSPISETLEWARRLDELDTDLPRRLSALPEAVREPGPRRSRRPLPRLQVPALPALRAGLARRRGELRRGLEGNSSRGRRGLPRAPQTQSRRPWASGSDSSFFSV